MRLPAALLLASTAACSATVEDDVHPDATEISEAGVSVQGAVTVHSVRSGAWSDVDRDKTRISARFVRVSGGIEQTAAERVVGAPRFDVTAPLGCAVLGLDEEPVVEATGSIELLDVGDIVLKFFGDTKDEEPAAELPLAARAFPDVADLVSGVVYTSRDGSEALPAGGTFVLETSGSAQVEGFTMRIEAPRAPSFVSVGDLDGLAYPSEPLALSWDAGHPASGDRIYVDLIQGSVADPVESELEGRAVRCVFEDDGHAVVPAAAMAFAPGGAIEVELHRHRRTALEPKALEVEGLDEIVVEFDFAITTPVPVAE